MSSAAGARPGGNLLVMEIERFCVQDGPGIRTTVFLKGCALHCPWCANPESQQRVIQLMHDGTLCARCGACAACCPHGAVICVAGGLPVFDRTKCTACGACARACPAGAIAYSGKWLTPEEIMETVLRDKDYYAASGGGITLSGGEPLAWGAALLPLLELCRTNGIHTAAETCGHFPADSLPELLPFFDLLLFDVKHADRGRLQAVAGGDLVLVLNNLDAVLTFGTPVTVRVPVVPGFNHTAEEMGALLGLLSEHGVRDVELLPYHTLGKSKYARLGLPYTLDGTMLTQRDLAPYRAAGERLGLCVRIGG